MRAGVVTDTMITDELCKCVVKPLALAMGECQIDFVYDSVVYQLEPAAIAATKGIFHHLAEMMQRDLKHVGCPYIQYKWELD